MFAKQLLLALMSDTSDWRREEERWTRFSLHLHVAKREGKGVTSYREICLSLDPFAIIVPKVAPGHKLSGQHCDDDHAQEELHESPEPNLDFRRRVHLLRSNLLPSSKPFVPLAFARKPFLMFLLLLVPILLVPDYNKMFASPLREGGR